MKNSKSKITPEMTMAEIVKKYPKAAEILTFEYGLHCVGCHVAGEESLKDGAKVHGIEGGEFEKLLNDLNERA